MSTNILVERMKNIRILPGAAGLIALTATIGFVDGRYEPDTECVSRNRITPLIKEVEIAANGGLSRTHQGGALGPVYLVEFRRGEKIVKVLIDADNGQIILS